MDLDQLDIATLLSRFLKRLELDYPDRQAQRDLIRLPGTKRINHLHSSKCIDCSQCSLGALTGPQKGCPLINGRQAPKGDAHFLPAPGE